MCDHRLFRLVRMRHWAVRSCDRRLFRLVRMRRWSARSCDHRLFRLVRMRHWSARSLVAFWDLFSCDISSVQKFFLSGLVHAELILACVRSYLRCTNWDSQSLLFYESVLVINCNMPRESFSVMYRPRSGEENWKHAFIDFFHCMKRVS